MMNKAEQNMLDMARASAKGYKDELDRIKENIQNLKGYLKVYETFDFITEKEFILCEAVLKYLK